MYKRQALKAFEEELNRLVAQPCPFHINLFNMENARYVLLLAGAQPLDCLLYTSRCV